MICEITFLPTGELRVRVPDGQDGIDFAQARAKIQQIQRDLGVIDVPVVWEGVIEQHVRGRGEAVSHRTVSFGSRTHSH